MVKPFIRNHQYNLIKKQAGLLQHACNTVSDPKVVESVRYSAQSKIIEAFPDATELQKQTLEKISTLNTAEEFQHYLRSLEPYLAEFAQVTEKQLKKLFPKNRQRKLKSVSQIYMKPKKSKPNVVRRRVRPKRKIVLRSCRWNRKGIL